MTSFALIALLGFLLGMRHATDPDHVIAVSTIVCKQRGIARAGLIGAIWGLGHTFTIFVVGAAIILFKVAIPTRVGLSMEMAVGLMLILLGTLNLTGVLPRLMVKFVANATAMQGVETSGGEPTAFSSPAQTASIGASASPGFRDMQSMARFNLLRPLVVGVVHGLAGSAAVALLVMTTIRDPWGEIGYLLIFGFGTVAGMMLITALMAVPFAYTARRFSGWNHSMELVSGLLSVSFGMVLSYQTGIAGGLFGAHPHWIPR